jgi:hypothetical protein
VSSSRLVPCTGLCYLLQLEKLSRELGVTNNKDKVELMKVGRTFCGTSEELMKDYFKRLASPARRRR